MVASQSSPLQCCSLFRDQIYLYFFSKMCCTSTLRPGNDEIFTDADFLTLILRNVQIFSLNLKFKSKKQIITFLTGCKTTITWASFLVGASRNNKAEPHRHTRTHTHMSAWPKTGTVGNRCYNIMWQRTSQHRMICTPKIKDEGGTGRKNCNNTNLQRERDHLHYRLWHWMRRRVSVWTHDNQWDNVLMWSRHAASPCIYNFEQFLYSNSTNREIKGETRYKRVKTWTNCLRMWL